jgi:alkaline phosphatase D
MGEWKAAWRVLVNDVMFAPMDLGSFAGERRFNMDAWDGYEGDRNRIFDVLEKDTLRNLVVVTGDIHTAWAIELTRNPMDKDVYERRSGKGVWGAEFVTPSISSPNLDEAKGKFVASFAVPYIKAKKRNPHLRYLNAKDHGYMVVELTDEAATATWIYVHSVKKPTSKTKRKHTWSFPYNGSGLESRKP